LTSARSRNLAISPAISRCIRASASSITAWLFTPPDDLEEGEWRELEADEVKAIFA
jgi:hypothetical protein